ncbi:putative lipid II flippase FtsW [Patescibacteria group bacterium]
MKKKTGFFKSKRYKTQKKNNAINLKGIDIWLLIAIIVMSVIGIVMVYNSSVAIAIRDFSDQYYFAREQLKWLVLGVVAMIIFASINYRTWQKLAFPILIGTFVTLAAVFVPGLGVKAYGAHRWIKVGSIVLQPAELAKLALTIYLAAWLSVAEKRRFMSFLLLIFMVTGMVMLEPDMGTSVVLVATSVIIYFCSQAPLWHFGMLIPLLVSSFGILAYISPYRLRRVLSFLNPTSDPLGASYQIRQALLAIGSGGLLGVGFGQSRQKYEYLPEANTDSIFAIIAEETGFFGSVFIIFLFLFIIWRGFKIAHHNTRDKFAYLLSIGITSYFGIQSALNFMAMVALMPLTGIPLPLVSYGGSSLVITLSALGILLNISKNNSK